jgi:hypothetical protein
MPELLNTTEAARRLRLAPQTLNRWRQEGIGPAYVRVGRKVMYQADQLTAWLTAHRETRGRPVALADLDLSLPAFPTFAGDPLAIQRKLRDEWE